MRLFSRKKASLSEPLPPPEIDDGLWRRTLKQADMRSGLRRDKLLESIAVARRDAASLLANARTTTDAAAQRVATILQAKIDVAALETLSCAASSLVAVLPSLRRSTSDNIHANATASAAAAAASSSAFSSLGDLSSTTQAHLATVLLAGDPPPLVPEAAHLAAQINAYFSASAVIAFRATVLADPSVTFARTTKHPPTPSEISKEIQAIAREYNLHLEEGGEAVDPAVLNPRKPVVRHENNSQAHAAETSPAGRGSFMCPRVLPHGSRPSPADTTHSGNVFTEIESFQTHNATENPPSHSTVPGLLQPASIAPSRQNHTSTRQTLLPSVPKEDLRNPYADNIDPRPTGTVCVEPVQAANMRVLHSQDVDRANHDVLDRQDISTGNSMISKQLFDTDTVGFEQIQIQAIEKIPTTNEQHAPRLSSAIEIGPAQLTTALDGRDAQLPEPFLDDNEMLLLRYKELMTI